MQKGLTLPNRTWENWTEEEIQAIIGLRPGVVQVLVFHQQPDDIWAAQKRQLLIIFQATGCEFEYRLCGIGPSDDPQHIADWAKVKLHGLPKGKVIPGNEMNHPIEGWIGSDWVTWLRRFAIAWNGGHELITPALSPNFEGYLADMEKMLGLVEEGLYDYLGVHVYSDHHITGLGDAKVCVTECNGDLPEKVFNWVIGSEEAIWFSSKWIEPDPDYHWDLIGNEEFSASFKRWREEEAAMPEDTTTPQFQIGNRWYDSLIGQLPTRYGAAPYRARSFSEIEEITIHHSGCDTALLTPLYLAGEMVTHDGPNRTKYPEIPYHIVIEKNGHVTVCLSLDTLSWHADGAEAREGVGMNNWRGVGVCLIGDFTTHPPSGAQLAALKELCAEIDFAMGKPLKKVRHSDVQNTSCPGATSILNNLSGENWFDQLFNSPIESDPLEARIQFLEQENATLKKRDAAQKALLARLLTIHEDAAALIRLNM